MINTFIQESKKSQHQNPKTCDCQVADNCPHNGNFKQPVVIYQTDVALIITLLLSMNNRKINQDYLLLSGIQKIRHRISKLSGW